MWAVRDMEPLKLEETIVAKATAPGFGGVGIVRVSGPLVFSIATALLKQALIPRYASYLPFWNVAGEIEDQGIALFFKGPNSFTGEDVLELQGHGGPVVMDRILRNVVALGARMARPGEFLERAFLNNKIDLLQAEAVHDLIHANTEAAARGAMRSLQGEFSNQITHITQQLIKLRMYVEAALDFPEEEIELLEENGVLSSLMALIQAITQLKREACNGALLSEGIKVVIAGKPNAGKSSLLNVLSGFETAIVTDIPGTTRDILREEINIDGLRLQLIDTAGLREVADVIEQEGIRRAHEEIKRAEHVIWVVDATASHSETHPELMLSEVLPEGLKFSKDIPITIFRNKIDILNTAPSIEKMANYTVVSASVKTKAGLDLFREHLKESAGFGVGESTFTARRRHLEALNRVEIHLLAGELHLKAGVGLELLAEELRLSQLSLDEMTGKFTSDDLLGKIFSEFCIGK